MILILKPLGLDHCLEYELGHRAAAYIAVAYEKYSHYSSLLGPVSSPGNRTKIIIILNLEEIDQGTVIKGMAGKNFRW